MVAAADRRGPSARRGPGTARLALALGVLLGSCCCSTAKPAPPASPTPVPAVKPEAIVGYWLVETRVGEQSIEGKLHFTYEGGILAGSLTGPDGNSQELTDIVIDGSKISWDAGNLHSEGTVDGMSMKGKSKRVARRRQEGESDGDSGSSGGGSPVRGGGGRGGRMGGRRGGGGAAREITWSAYKTVPPSESPAIPPAPTPSKTYFADAGAGRIPSAVAITEGS